MTCAGTGRPTTRDGRCSACDRFAAVTLAPGSAMPSHTRARVLTDDEVMAAIPRLPWEAAQERAIQQVVGDLLQPRGDADGE